VHAAIGGALLYALGVVAPRVLAVTADADAVTGTTKPAFRPKPTASADARVTTADPAGGV
jgi:hypothetical protein